MQPSIQLVRFDHAPIYFIMNVLADFGTFDFIIVGSGSGGGVLAYRLTEIKNYSVLLIEAGQNDPVITKILGLTTFCIFSPWNWGYNTTVQNNSCLGKIFMFLDFECVLQI